MVFTKFLLYEQRMLCRACRQTWATTNQHIMGIIGIIAVPMALAIIIYFNAIPAIKPFFIGGGLMQEWVVALIGIALVIAWVLGVFTKNLVLAPSLAEKEMKAELIEREKHIKILEEERIPKFAVSSSSGRRHYDYENPHLMWVELRVTNTSPIVTLRDVEVQIATQLDIVDIREGGRNAPVKHHLHDRGTWSRVSILWSELDVTPSSTRINIPPGATKVAVLAFQDASNGQWTIYNAPISPKPMSVGGAKIEVEVHSIDSALWKRNYYIECHPNYTDGTLARFEFVEWDTWMETNDVIQPSTSHKEGSQTE